MGRERDRDVKKIREMLQNPFALVGQGFVVGGLFFWTAQADAAGFLTALF